MTVIEAPITEEIVVVPMEIPEEAAMLESAADILENEGWVQGHYSYFVAGGQVVGRCAVGGLQEARKRLGFGTDEKAIEILFATIWDRSPEEVRWKMELEMDERELDDPHSGVVFWNDEMHMQDEDGKKDVVRTLREAAARANARSEETPCP